MRVRNCPSIDETTVSGSVFFDRMKNSSLYLTDIEQISRNVARADMAGFFARPLR